MSSAPPVAPAAHYHHEWQRVQQESVAGRKVAATPGALRSPLSALPHDEQHEGNPVGQLIDGDWFTGWYDTSKTGGRFERTSPRFRNWVTADGEPGPSGEGGFEARPGRYHLYVSYACPWAHRTLIL